MRILVVEDYEDSRIMLGLLLRRFGHDATLAADAVHALALALALAGEATFDVLLLDVCLPDIPGWELVETLRAAGSLPRRVFSMSGGDAVTYWEHSRAAGCERHFVKPMDLAALKEALDTIVPDGTLKT